MKRLVFLLLGIVFLLSACQRPNDLQSVAFYPSDTFAFHTFDFDDLKLQLTYERGEPQIIALDVAYLENSDLSLLNVPGSRSVKVTYEGVTTELTLSLEAPEAWVSLGSFYVAQRTLSLTELDFESWLETIRGADGRGIASVRYEDDVLVLVLDDGEEIEVGALRGPQGVRGEDGTDGLTPSLFVEDQTLKVHLGQTVETLFDLSALKPKEVLSMRLTEDNDVVVVYDDLSIQTMGRLQVTASALAIDNVSVTDGELIVTLGDGTVLNAGSIVGPQGPRGPQGLQGLQGPTGSQVEFRLSAEGLLQFKYDDDADTGWQTLLDTEDLIGPQGPAAPKVQMRQVDDRLEWKYDNEPDSAYRVLTTVADFQGAQGEQGPAIELRFNQTIPDEPKLEFRYQGESNDAWTSLLTVDQLQGIPGVGLRLMVSGASIYWAQDTEDPIFTELTALETLRAPTNELRLFDDETIKWRTVDGDEESWQTLVSLSAIQGDRGVTGRGIHALTLSGSALMIAYDDAPETFTPIGTFEREHLVIFSLPTGQIVNVQKVTQGLPAATPSAFAVPFGFTVAGFSAPFNRIDEPTDITVMLDALTLTLHFENTTLSALELTNTAALTLPTPAAPYLHEFVGWVMMRNGIPVPLYDGYPLEILFAFSTEVTLHPHFRRFVNTTEEARIAMLEKALAATVTVLNTDENDDGSLGSGVIYRQLKVSDNEYHYWVVTNEHVVEGAARLDVEYYINGHPFTVLDVNLIGVDPINDVAVISFSALHPISPLLFADTTRVQSGQTVYALGSPLGNRFFHSVASGILIGIRRNGLPQYTDSYFIQHDAAINPGNSGGPLIDSNGDIVGLNTWKIFQASDGRPTEGFGFAVTSLIVQRVIADVEAGTSLNRRLLGITSTVITTCAVEAIFGVCIDAVNPGGIAAELGLESNDIIVAFQHARMPQISPTATVDVLREYLFSTRLNESFTVYFVRNGIDMNVTYDPSE